MVALNDTNADVWLIQAGAIGSLGENKINELGRRQGFLGELR